MALSALVGAQVKRVINPTIDYSRSPQRYYIGGITVSGVDNYDEYLLVGLSSADSLWARLLTFLEKKSQWL